MYNYIKVSKLGSCINKIGEAECPMQDWGYMYHDTAC